MLYTNKTEIVALDEKLPSDSYDIVKTFDELNGKNWLLYNKKQADFYEANPNATPEEVYNMELTQAPERTLEQAKAEKLSALFLFDNSEDGTGVNNFFLQMGEHQIPSWISAEKRAIYMTSINSAKLIQEETIELDLMGQFIELPVTTAEMILAKVHRYADKAANVTARHKEAIEALTDIEEVDEYDFTTGYPDKVIIPLS